MQLIFPHYLYLVRLSVVFSSVAIFSRCLGHRESEREKNKAMEIKNKTKMKYRWKTHPEIKILKSDETPHNLQPTKPSFYLPLPFFGCRGSTYSLTHSSAPLPRTFEESRSPETASHSNQQQTAWYTIWFTGTSEQLRDSRWDLEGDWGGHGLWDAMMRGAGQIHVHTLHIHT